MRTKLAGRLMLTALVIAAGTEDLHAADQSTEAQKGGNAVAESALIAQAGDVQVQICRWRYDKTAAINLRFDDSRVSHLKIAIPVLNEYDLVGTFLIICDGKNYLPYREQWEQAVIESGHELGNHTMHHRGVASDEEAEYEIGECSRYIWGLFPEKSKLLAFWSGGGTTWNIKKPWSYYYDKWHLIREPHHSSVGTDPEAVKIWNLEMFKAKVDQTIADGEWVSLYFHDIGPAEYIHIGEQPFRDMMRYVHRQRKQIWVGGIAQVYKYQAERDAARISAEAVEPHKLKIEVNCDTDPELYDEPLTVRIDLTPEWPLYDVQALDADENPIAIRRTSETWDRLLIDVPPVRGTYYVHVVDPREGQPEPALPDESERSVSDPATGLAATICKWFDGRRAALHIRFDDSRQSHILLAVPLLRQHGFKGTFFINPGNRNYNAQREKWEEVAREGDQEFANHTLHHHGAENDDEADYEIGEVSRYIWSLFPDNSKLLAFSKGGGSTWALTRPFRHYLDKYHLFRPPYNNISMADSYEERYGDMVEHFREGLSRAIEHGSWTGTSYHPITSTPEGLSTSEENFRAVLEITKQHQDDLWIAGITDIWKYQEERASAKLAIQSREPERVTLHLSCGMDPELYDYPLTIQLTLPAGWSPDTLKVSDADGDILATRTATEDGQLVVRFDVPPTDADYVIARQ